MVRDRRAGYAWCWADRGEGQRDRPMLDSWLDRSGQRWKLQWSRVLTPASWAIWLCGMALVSQRRRAPGDVGMYVVFAGVGVACIALMLPYLVRCSVCKLHLKTSEAIRRTPIEEQAQWLSQLSRCPVCGDDGAARADSRVRWYEAGSPREAPYWSTARLTLGGVATLLILAAAIVLGRWWGLR